ncbi:hypothetical protein J7T55_009837 [Diaporthe amygdali]|uniref:uncharacterized protein n=1 Tax=Phomopsis amygdali TaxID=1214568 RepID=UPI0022FE452C|nr:uncharacterized protein J7T55_009837 [Diaporthe amygdali]KAJ0116687.1 hypothetical protein J7T55_009837 [Diaporthe amygdali]
MSSGSHVRGDPWLIQVLTPVAVLVTAVVGVRFSLRISRRTGFWLDDWFILASLVFVWGMYAISVLGVEIGGNGTPFRVNMATDPSMAWMGHLLKLLFASQMVYASAIMTAKLSILALYWRLFPTAFMKRGCVILAVLTVMWWGAYVLVDIFQCKPVGMAFDSSLHSGDYCISQTGYCLGMIIPNILMDVMILCLPTFEVSKLQLPRGQRCALASVFLLGAGVTSAGGVRMYYHLQLVESGYRDFDFTMKSAVNDTPERGKMVVDLYNPQLWMTLEPDMAVICACLPVMRPLVTMLLASPLYRYITSYLSFGSSTSRSGKHPSSNTISGSSVARSSAAQRGATNDNSRLSNDHHSGYELSPFDSLEYLRDEDVEAGRLVRNDRDWPSQGDNSIGCQTQVSRSDSIGPDEIPLGAISVKTVVDFRETTDGPTMRN